MKYLKLNFCIAICLAFYSLTLCSAFAENSLGNINKNIDTTCKEDWTKRGELIVHMYDDCVNRNKEKLVELKNIRKKFSKFNWYESHEKRCIDEWTKKGAITYFMMVNCIEGETDSYLTLEYYRKKGLNKLVDSCIEKTTKELGYTFFGYAKAGCVERNTDIR